MSLNRKFRTCFITFLLLVSSLSVFVINSEQTRGLDIEDFFMQISGFHPYITAGVYEYNGTEPMKLTGNITFELYYSNTLASMGRYKDDLIVTVYSYSEINPLIPFRKIKNANATVTLKPEVLGDLIQKCTVTLENISYTMNPGELLIFTVEVVQNDKPIGNIVEKRYERTLKSRLGKIADYLNKSSDEQVNEIGTTILAMLELTEEFGVSGEEIASLADSLCSSSFVYNSAEYPSSVKLSFNSSGDKTLYFNYEWDDLNSTSEFPITLIEQVPSGSTKTWPARLINIGGSEDLLNVEEWMLWLETWLAYIIEPYGPDEDENIFEYFLSANSKLTTEEPEGYSPLRISIKDTKTWESSPLAVNKIIENATAELFIYYPRIFTLRKVTINATLYDGETALASATKQLGLTSIFELLQKGPNSALDFTFDDAIGKEIWNGNNITLKVTATGGAILGLRQTQLLYASKDYASSLVLKLGETDNIKISDDLEDKPVIPGGTAEFKLNISSKYKDTLTIDVVPDDPDSDDWTIDYTKSVNVEENGRATVSVFVTSNDNTINADGDEIDLEFIVTGKTGKDTEKASVEVSKDAVDYNIIVDMPKDKDIKHGTSGTYTFFIKNNNTGVWPDNYRVKAKSEHNWTVEFEYDKNEDVAVGKELMVNVTVSIPKYTDITSDELEVTFISKESGEEYSRIVMVKTTVITPNVFEKFYQFFESVAEDLGLDDSLGDLAGAFLIFLLFFTIFFFLVIAIYLVKKKFVDIICTDRIKEITPDEQAVYEITIKNPSKRPQTFEIKYEVESDDAEKWDVSLDRENIVIDGRQTSNVSLIVRPTDNVTKEDWVEVKVIAAAVGRKKICEISTMTSVKDAKPEVKITGVLHWPRVFKKGDRVETSFRLTNRGNAAANNITVILCVNGEEKNKVEGINIPRGGYAEIEIPWIAEKGKNDVNIVVK